MDKQYNTNHSFKAADNLTDEQKEIIKLKKRIKRNWSWYFKTSGCPNGTKAQVIFNNRNKYSISLMSRLLDISRQTYYNYINNMDINKLKQIN